MSFDSSKSEGLPQFKKFVSEEELEEKRRKRQEEWEKVRTPDQPLEAPEEEVDARCLFDKLEEQKQKKQDEYEEKFKLSNQVKGLDTDEAEFLDYVSHRQQQVEKARLQEDYEVIRECRKAMVTRVAEQSTMGTVNPAPTVSKPGTCAQTKKSQSSLLAGAVKRKGSQAESNDIKKKKGSSPDNEGLQTAAEDSVKNATGEDQAEVIGILPGGLPGMGAYSDSSDSNSDSSDSEIDTDIFQHKRIIKIVQDNC